MKKIDAMKFSLYKSGKKSLHPCHVFSSLFTALLTNLEATDDFDYRCCTAANAWVRQTLCIYSLLQWEPVQS